MIRLWDTAGTLLAAHEPLAPPVRVPDDMAWCRPTRAERIEFRVHRASAVAEALIRAETDGDHIVAVDMPGGVFRGRVIAWATSPQTSFMRVEVVEFARERQVSCVPPPQGSSTAL